MSTSERLLSEMKDGQSYTKEELIQLAGLDPDVAHKLLKMMVVGGYLTHSASFPMRYQKRLR